jgi:hypothetical protein
MRLVAFIFFVLPALPGCGLLPEQSFSLPNTDLVLRYPAGWHVSRDADRYGPITVFSPDAKPGPASTRITLQAGRAAPRPRPHAAAANSPDLTLAEDLGTTTEGLRAGRFFVARFPNAWAIEVYAPPSDFATIRSAAQRMAAALNRPAKPGPKK